MNEKLPKSMLDALASQPPPADHPSADALTAYMEQGLNEAERSPVADHLARCRECREVVFLASGAVEEKQELLLVAAAAAASPKPGSRWMPRPLWVGSIAAGLLVAGYLVRDRYATHPREAIVASNRAAQTPAPPLQAQPETAQQAQALPEVATALANAPSRVPPKKAAHAAAVLAAPSAVLNETAAQAKVTASIPASKSDAVPAQALNPAPEQATIAVGGAVPPKSFSPHVSSFAPSANREAGQDAVAASSGLYLNRVLSGAPSSAHPAWRVNTDGQVEHQTEDGWSRTLADQTVAFRVVYARGNEVWAGGDNGTLFHSSDGGQHWNKVALTGANGPESGAIATIRFSTPQQGIVITAGSIIYTSSDGGATWARK